MKFLVINGVNLNLTGLREKSVYGTKTLEQINEELREALEAKQDLDLEELCNAVQTWIIEE